MSHLEEIILIVLQARVRIIYDATLISVYFISFSSYYYYYYFISFIHDKCVLMKILFQLSDEVVSIRCINYCTC